MLSLMVMIERGLAKKDNTNKVPSNAGKGHLSVADQGNKSRNSPHWPVKVFHFMWSGLLLDLTYDKKL